MIVKNKPEIKQRNVYLNLNMKEAFIYSIKVWVTSVLLGPLLLFILIFIFGIHPNHHLRYFIHFDAFIYFELKYGIYLYLIGLLLLFLSVIFINMMGKNIVLKKALLTTLYIVLMLIMNRQFIVHLITRFIINILAWATIIIGSIWFYQLRPAAISTDSD